MNLREKNSHLIAVWIPLSFGSILSHCCRLSTNLEGVSAMCAKNAKANNMRLRNVAEDVYARVDTVLAASHIQIIRCVTPSTRSVVCLGRSTSHDSKFTPPKLANSTSTHSFLTFAPRSTPRPASQETIWYESS